MFLVHKGDPITKIPGASWHPCWQAQQWGQSFNWNPGKGWGTLAGGGQKGDCSVPAQAANLASLTIHFISKNIIDEWKMLIAPLNQDRRLTYALTSKSVHSLAQDDKGPRKNPYFLTPSKKQTNKLFSLFRWCFSPTSLCSLSSVQAAPESPPCSPFEMWGIKGSPRAKGRDYSSHGVDRPDISHAPTAGWQQSTAYTERKEHEFWEGKIPPPSAARVQQHLLPLGN